ncbi:AIG2-like family domain-containing protein [Ditylenchus destructor]|nr:AIG2-like family domain-containing protein [Ditylenchus destructor]
MTVTQTANVLLDNYFYYFAYGSNLLKERIHVQIKGAVFETIGKLNHYELVFFDTSLRWCGAIGSIEEKPGNEMWGCVWKVPNEFAAELDLQEIFYHRLDVTVWAPAQEREIVCRTYQYSSPERVRDLPSPHYKQVIVSGAIEHALPADYVEKLSAMPHNDYCGRVQLDLAVLKELNSREEKEEELEEMIAENNMSIN